MRETATSMNHELERDRRNNSTNVEQLGDTEEPKGQLLEELRYEVSRLAPRNRLRYAASGRTPLRLEDLEALLADHVLTSDGYAGQIGTNCRQLMEAVFTPSAGINDPMAALKLIKQLTKLHQAHQSEVRKTVELIARIHQPRPPQVQVLSVEREE